MMDIIDQIQEIADRDKLPEDHALRLLAKELHDVITNDPTPEKLIGAWARARRAYCDYTGIPLVEPSVVETGQKLAQLFAEASKTKK